MTSPVEACLLGLDVTLLVSVENGEKAVSLAEALGEGHTPGRAEFILGAAIKDVTDRYEAGDEWFLAGDELVKTAPGSGPGTREPGVRLISAGVLLHVPQGNGHDV